MRTAEFLTGLAEDVRGLAPGQTVSPDIFDGMRDLNAAIAQYVRQQLEAGAQITFQPDPEAG